MKTGLVLEGGVMRGMYTAGVLDVLMEQGILVDGVVGVSAGAVFGCNYKSRQIGRSIRYNMKYCRDPRYGDFRSLLKSGNIYEEEFCYCELPDRLDPFDWETYKSSPVEFYVVCTDVDTGRAVYHRCSGEREDLRWMQASASMPFVSRIVEINGRQLLDGGISDSIPVDWFRSVGYEKNLVVLTRPKGFRKKPPKGLPLLQQMIRRYPALSQAVKTRHIRYNQTLDRLQELEKAGMALVLRPSRRIRVSKLERHPRKLRALYELGRKDTERRLERIRRFLA
ncbi:MAG: patatin family protein [Acetatifactor sp.]|nr:patatin family protein [Acetatifactor sp.]